jgi:hypothetical protein
MNRSRYLPVFVAAVAMSFAVVGLAAQPTKDITFDTIKFDIKKGQKFKRTMLTPAIEGMKAQKVRLRGYMLPPYQTTGITKFVLVRDSGECCFGPDAMIYDCVMVEMQEGASATFTGRAIQVEGTFDIEPVDDGNGNLMVLYQLRGNAVK